jgi:hypothetical protein
MGLQERGSDWRGERLVSVGCGLRFLSFALCTELPDSLVRQSRDVVPDIDDAAEGPSDDDDAADVPGGDASWGRHGAAIS